MNDLGRRYMLPRDFLNYAYRLAILDAPGQEYVLEFLEKERLLVPACRVRFPDEIVRRAWAEQDGNQEGVDTSLPTESDGPRWDAAMSLGHDLWTWPASSDPGFHPLDLVDPEYATFVQADVAAVPFQPWRRMQPHVGQFVEGHPVHERDEPRTYYHYWQVFQLAELLAARRSILAAKDDLEALPPDRRLTMVRPFMSFGAKEIANYVPAFDSVAVFLDYRSRYWRLVAEGYAVGSRLSPADVEVFEGWERACAAHALKWSGLDAPDLLVFIGWQCGRWREWSRYGPPAMADEYKHNVVQSVYLYRVATRADYDQVLNTLGRDGQTLEAMLPDWIKQQREAAADSLRRWVAPSLQTFAAVGHHVALERVADFAQWVSDRGLLQFFLVFAQLAEVRKLDARVRPAMLANTVRGLGSTLEHILHELADQAPSSSGRDLKGRLRWLWDDEPNVCGPLRANWSLTQTDPGFAVQQAVIRTLNTGTAWAPVVRTLLEAALIRNQGTHRSFPGLDEEQFYECTRLLLRTALLNWKHAEMRGFA